MYHFYTNVSKLHDMNDYLKRENFEKCMQCEDKDFCTICMMKNYNEDQDEDMFKPNHANCKLSSILHKKVMQYIKE